MPYHQRTHHREKPRARPAATPGLPDKAWRLAATAQESWLPPRLNSRYSHARARLQSCRTVRGETFSAVATSSSFKPPKYRNSTCSTFSRLLKNAARMVEQQNLECADSGGALDFLKFSLLSNPKRCRAPL